MGQEVKGKTDSEKKHDRGYNPPPKLKMFDHVHYCCQLDNILMANESLILQIL